MSASEDRANHPQQTSAGRLFEILLKEIERITSRIIKRLRQLGSYGGVPTEALYDGASTHVRAMITATRDRRTKPTSEERRMFASIGDTRAHQGIPIEDLLRGWRIGSGTVWTELRAAGDRLGLADTDLLADLEVLLAFTDEAMIATTLGHRQAELEIARRESAHRHRFVRGVLGGSLSAADVNKQAEVYGLDAARPYHAVRAHASDAFGSHDLEGMLCRWSGVGVAALLTTSDGDIVGLASEVERPTPPVAVGVGPPARLDAMVRSYALATRALTTATAFGLTGMVQFADLGIRPAVVADRDISERLVARYIDPLCRGSAPLVETAEAFLECGLSVARASDRLHIHQNTLRYRLERIGLLTGVDFDDLGPVVELWWALQSVRLKIGTAGAAPTSSEEGATR